MKFIVSKDQIIGWLIFIVCTVVIVGYVVSLFGYEQVIQPILNLGPTSNIQFWLIAIPVLIAFVTILAIGAWILLNKADKAWEIGALLWIGRFMICGLTMIITVVSGTGFLMLCSHHEDVNITLKLPGFWRN